MDNSINFKSAFVVYKPNVVLRQAIKAAGKLNQNQILPEYAGKNTVLYVVNDSFDKNVANILIGTPKSKFRYFPTLDNKSGFNVDNKPEALDMLIKARETAINTKEKLINIFKQKNRDIIANNINKIHKINLELLSKEISIKLDDNNYKKQINTQTGICKVITDVIDSKTGKTSKHTLIKITPPDKSGICYATYIPISKKEKMRSIAINKNGEKVFEYSNPTSEYFKGNIKKAKKYYLSLLQKQDLFIS